MINQSCQLNRMTPSTIYRKPQRVLFSKLRLGPQAAIVSAHVNIRSDSGSPELLADVKSKRTPKQNKWPRERTPGPNPAMKTLKSYATMRCEVSVSHPKVPNICSIPVGSGHELRCTNDMQQHPLNLEREHAVLCYRSIVSAPCDLDD